MGTSVGGHGAAHSLKSFTDADAALARIRHIYETGAALVRDRFARFLSGDRGPDKKPIAAFYPYLGIAVPAEALASTARPAHGAVPDPGTYGATLTRPDIFADYLREQISDLMDNHGVPVVVGVSDRPIPLPFVIEDATADVTQEDLRALQRLFTLPDLARVEDSIANGTFKAAPGEPLPLSLFNAERIDLALNRLHHYTGTSASHFQRFVLFTNYQRYVDEFVAHGRAAAGGDGYDGFIVTGGPLVTSGPGAGAVKGPPISPQMPAYHLTRPDREGITLVNIGVGPANSKTITDHFAVLRPHCWIMIGHCGGLRRSQILGDYVLAHAYIREDHVLDQDLPAWIPVPPIAEIQIALQRAVERITGLKGLELKHRMRTGTVASTDNRNWELRFSENYERLNQSRAIAIDMESATIAANGFRLRVPYGTLLCVSDKPLHGEVKLRGMASAFYRERISQHLKIGLETIRILREAGVEQLQSRKLRSFREPPFR